MENTAVYMHTVNGDGSKTAKVKKAILTTQHWHSGDVRMVNIAFLMTCGFRSVAVNSVYINCSIFTFITRNALKNRLSVIQCVYVKVNITPNVYASNDFRLISDQCQ